MFTGNNYYLDQLTTNEWLVSINDNLTSNTNYAIIQMRQFSEYFTKQIAKKEIPSASDFAFAQMLDILIQKQLIDFKLYKLFSGIRLIGNKAAHEGYNNQFIAKQMYDELCNILGTETRDSEINLPKSIQTAELFKIGNIELANLSTNHQYKNKFFIPNNSENDIFEDVSCFCYIPDFEMSELDDEEGFELPLYANSYEVSSLLEKTNSQVYTEYNGRIYETQLYVLESAVEEARRKKRSRVFLGYISAEDNFLTKDGERICNIISPIVDEFIIDDYYDISTNFCSVDCNAFRKETGEVLPLYAYFTSSSGDITCKLFVQTGKEYIVTLIDSSDIGIDIIKLIDEDVSKAFELFYQLRDFDQNFFMMTLGYKNQIGLALEEMEDIGIIFSLDYELESEIIKRDFNHPQFQFVLGMIGKKAFIDPLVFMKALEKAANYGHSLAANIVGEIYDLGKRGIKVDHKKAFHYYKLAAEKGLTLAQRNLAALYELGQGVEINYEKAKYWYKKAAKMGDEFSKERLLSSYSIKL